MDEPLEVLGFDTEAHTAPFNMQKDEKKTWGKRGDDGCQEARATDSEVWRHKASSSQPETTYHRTDQPSLSGTKGPQHTQHPGGHALHHHTFL